eukprot:TRINITY_DN5229_c0_g1_i2.p1 TRINITY_DN5229_c0_g1~~TRINITY_DN5229_c0_g1_i2.p1  ORF type:complete len:108 (+),score=21.66 TRINITY_DN5229_c0_g1_i2:345-668(+)
MVFDDWISVQEETYDPRMEPSRQLFAGNETTTTLYFILRTSSDFHVTANWVVSYTDEVKDTISASTLYTMGVTVSIIGSVFLILGIGLLFFFFYRVPPSSQQTVEFI